MECRGESASGLSVLMLPWLAHGHISPFLELGRRLSSRGFRVHLCSTPANLASVRLEDGAGVELVELHLPDDLPELPPHLHTTRNLPPHLMPNLKTAFDLAEPAFCGLLDSLRPSVVVYDFLQPWAPAAAATRNIPAVLFLSVGGAAYAFLSHLAAKPAEEFPFPSMRFDDDDDVARIRRMLHPVPDRPSNGDRAAQCSELSSSFVLIKTSREIEGKYIDYVSLLKGKEHVLVGPLVWEPRRHLGDDHRWHRFSAWLDHKPQSSVAFVSFGSEYFMSKKETTEVARGLELSGVGFIWVLRFPKGEEVPLENALPEGFLRRNSGRGIVVEDWAPQGGILAHAAVGAFVTHCGWSSVMEALRWGVPMVAAPLHLDQPLNAKVVAELDVGVEVRRAAGDKERRYGGEELAWALRSAMSGEGSEGMRRRAREMGEVLRRRGDHDVDIAAAKLAGLCSAATAKVRRESM
ncbi:unnamed protein product [Spirodela intermedia]|uniref:Glycosyltransferase n=1 Tax=Spirodela intermedia TaxID=51605 RepID=A0A7I8KHD5_SPIIN|nr:unnamed protein product [Spirodela intermedia]